MNIYAYKNKLAVKGANDGMTAYILSNGPLRMASEERERFDTYFEQVEVASINFSELELTIVVDNYAHHCYKMRVT